jgi:hypothetical protein
LAPPFSQRTSSVECKPQEANSAAERKSPRKPQGFGSDFESVHSLLFGFEDERGPVHPPYELRVPCGGPLFPLRSCGPQNRFTAKRTGGRVPYLRRCKGAGGECPLSIRCSVSFDNWDREGQFPGRAGKQTKALKILMRQHTGEEEHTFLSEAVDATSVFVLHIQEMSGKQSGDHKE